MAEHLHRQSPEAGKVVATVIVVVGGKVLIDHVPVGDNQGLSLIDLKDHPRADRHFTERGQSTTPLDHDVGPHGALQGRLKLLDLR